jgi:RPA family protein
MENKKDYVRQIAVKITIQKINRGNYIQTSEQEPNYLVSSDNQKIYRLNLFAIVLKKEELGSITNLLIDDGTGQITLRSFEDNKIIENLNIGDAISLIGKVRAYNQEKYISPEIIKKINSLWLKVRSLELKDEIESEKKETKIVSKEIKEEVIDENNKEIENVTNVEKVDDQKSNEDDESNISDKNKEEILLPSQKIISIVKKLDKGQGVNIEDVIEKSPLNDTEDIIEKMLEKGEIYQNLPGKIKVL